MSNEINLLYRFAPEVKTLSRDDTRLGIEVEGWKTLSFTTATNFHADAIEALSDSGATLEKLQHIAAGTGSVPDGKEAICYYIERFSQARLLHWELVQDGESLARVTPLAAGYRPHPDPLPTQRLSLCRFAYIRNTSEGLVLESSLVRACIHLNPRGMELVSQALAQPHLDAKNIMAGILWRLGFFDVENPQEDNSRKCWEFHDILMHETSRFNRDLPGGGTYRFKDKFAAAPAKKEAMPGERINLPVVDISKIKAISNSLDEVQPRRKSVRSYSTKSIDLSTLSEFLWRVARTTAAPWSNGPQELMSRAYPAGGSINELEFYVAVRRCEGLDPAFYHYDSHHHGLVRLKHTEKLASKIVESSGGAMGLKPEEAKPDVTIVVSSRLPRLAWKYERMAYRASLLHAGVVIELMYLVATDMKLAPCANGSGDSRLFEQATGLNQFEETSIAEFCLGMLKES